MSDQKTQWDVISEFGRAGIISFAVFLLILWGFIHYLAEPGKTIDFAFWSYTKPLDVGSNAEQVTQQLPVMFSAIGLSASYGENPCSEIRVHDQYKNLATFDIKSTNLFVDPDFGLELVFKTVDEEFVLQTPGDIEVAGLFLITIFQNVKTHCLGGEVSPLNLSTGFFGPNGEWVTFPKTN